MNMLTWKKFKWAYKIREKFLWPKPKIKNFPKVKSPFIRKVIDDLYVVTPEIEPGYEWVFDGTPSIAVEKLDGTNVSVIIEDGEITKVFNRTARIPFFNKGKKHISEAILNSYNRGYCNVLEDGQYFGEVIGPKLNKNPYELDTHLWIPFEDYAKNHLCYKSWGKYPKNYKTIRNWFKDDLFSLFMRRRHGEKVSPEGIVFYNEITGEMAKLRMDMFDFFEGESIHRRKKVVK